MYAQCTNLTPKKDFSFRNGGKGRAITFRTGQRFWVASSQTEQTRGFAEVCRNAQSKGCGYNFPLTWIEEYFHVG